MQLTRERAVALSAELGELVVRLRTLEAKYGFDGAPGPLGEDLVAALRPFATDPLVAANAVRSGLDLGVAPPPHRRHLSSASAAALPADGQAQPALVRGRPGAAAAVAGAAPLSKQASSSSLAEGSAASSISTAAGPSSEAGTGSLSRATSEDSAGGAEEKRRVVLVPKSRTARESWTFDVEFSRRAQVRELRRLLAAKLRLPLGKVRLVAAMAHGIGAAATAVPLDDGDAADRAAVLYITSMTGTGPTGTPLRRDLGLALQRDLLAGLTAEGAAVPPPGHRPPSRELLLRVQSAVLPRYGFRPDPAGVAAMLSAFDALMWDAELADMGERINELLGRRPQTYDIEDWFPVH